MLHMVNSDASLPERAPWSRLVTVSPQQPKDGVACLSSVWTALPGMLGTTENVLNCVEYGR